MNPASSKPKSNPMAPEKRETYLVFFLYICYCYPTQYDENAVASSRLYNSNPEVARSRSGSPNSHNAEFFV
jgi:hypothetical protein